jgi:uncharacterized membrane protein (UPF0127 family)
MKLKKFEYSENKKKKQIKVKVCNSVFSKFRGLMFKKKSPALLFIFNKQKNISIHSLFCRPFRAVWLDKNKKVVKSININDWKPYISGKGKYLVEILFDEK